MSKGVLVSPIGLSPGAVTGTAIALMDVAKYDVSRVVTVGTSLPEVIGSTQIVGDLLRELRIEHDARHIAQVELRQKDGSSEAFMIAIGQALEAAFVEGNIVHVGVTGGRSGMGALASLATNIYGADHLWHLWVTEEIERNGRYDKLPRPYTLADNKYLNPTLARDEHELVELPFLSLRPYRPVLREYYAHYIEALQAGRQVEIPPTITPLIKMLMDLGVDRLEEIYPPQLPIKAADRIFEIKQTFPQASAEEQTELMDELLMMMGEYHVFDKSTVRRLKQLVQSGASGSETFQIITRDKDATGFIRQLRTHKDVIDLSLKASGVVISIVSLYLQWVK
jgi:hypothetical protein